MAGISFSVPANNGTAGHATTQTSLFLHIPAAPPGETCIFDYDLNGGSYYRLHLFASRHLLLEFSLPTYGTVTADLGAVPIATWVWVSCGFSSAGGLHIRGDVTPAYGATTTATALASSGSAAGTTLTDLALGLGVPITSGALDFPYDAADGWLCSKLIRDQIAADAAAGNPRPMPTTDFATGIAVGEYLAHDPLGPATALSDSGTAATDLPAGPQGLTIVTDGPALQPLVGGPAGPHEGDLIVFQHGAWINVHIGTTGQELTVVSGYPAWADEAVDPGETVQQAGSTVATRPTINFTSGATVTDDPSHGRVDVAVAGSGGTVTSISFAAPATFTVTGSPITGSGTITLAWASQGANSVLAGPASGAAAAPAFRALVPADLGLSAEGDLVYRHAGALSRLAAGAAGYAVVSDGADPRYADPVAGAPTRWEPITVCDGTCLITDACDPVMALAPASP